MRRRDDTTVARRRAAATAARQEIAHDFGSHATDIIQACGHNITSNWLLRRIAGRMPGRRARRRFADDAGRCAPITARRLKYDNAGVAAISRCRQLLAPMLYEPSSLAGMMNKRGAPARFTFFQARVSVISRPAMMTRFSAIVNMRRVSPPLGHYRLTTSSLFTCRHARPFTMLGVGRWATSTLIGWPADATTPAPAPFHARKRIDTSGAAGRAAAPADEAD